MSVPKVDQVGNGAVDALVQTASKQAVVLAREQEEPQWGFPGLAEVPVHGMERARTLHYDVVVATWSSTWRRRCACAGSDRSCRPATNGASGPSSRATGRLSLAARRRAGTEASSTTPRRPGRASSTREACQPVPPPRSTTLATCSTASSRRSWRSVRGARGPTVSALPTPLACFQGSLSIWEIGRPTIHSMCVLC